MDGCGRGCIYAVLGLLVSTSALRADEGDDGPQVLRDGFEAARPSWTEEGTDATFVLRTHDRTAELAHEGRFCERFIFEAGHGSGIHYRYDLPPSALSPDLKATLYVRSNRPGVQLFARVLLPEAIDPETGKPTPLLIAGSSLSKPNHWERLEIQGILLGVERQSWVLRQGTGRPISLEGAYLDSLVINLYAGAGDTEVELDELTVGPLTPRPETRPEPDPETGRVTRPASTAGPSQPEPPERPSSSEEPSASSRVRVAGSILQKDGKDWFPRIISAPGADIEQLRRAGPDVLVVDPSHDRETLEQAVKLGYLLMPRLKADSSADPQAPLGVPLKESVAFWDLGSDLGGDHDLSAREAQLDRVRQTIRSVHDLPPEISQIAGGTVSGMFPQYALFGQSLDIIGVDADGAFQSADPLETLHYLEQRRIMTATKNPTALFLAWVPASAPRVVQTAVWGEDVPPSWGWPQLQPEQMRLYTYAALSAGYRGLGFRASPDLGQPGGLDRLYEMTLLIAEVELLETVFARAHDPIAKVKTYPPDPKIKMQYNTQGRAGGFGGMGRGRSQNKEEMKERDPLETVKASVIDLPDGRSKLLVVADFAKGAQFMPPLMAQRELNILVPAAASAQAFEITLGGVTPLETKGDTGGRRVVLPVFNATALILLTPDLSLRDPLEAQIRALAPRAVDIAVKQAELQLQEAETIHALLAQRGQPVRQGDELVVEAKNELQKARDYQARLEFDFAWSFARSVGQALRLLRRAHWEHAMREFTHALRMREKTDGMPPRPVTVRVRPEGGGEVKEEDRWMQPPVVVNAVECPPLLSWQTLPQFYDSWLPVVSAGGPAFGPDRLPSGRFEVTPQELREVGWTDESYTTDGVIAKVSLSPKEGYMPKTTALKFEVLPDLGVDEDRFRKPDGKVDTDKLFNAARDEADKVAMPFLDHPPAAVRSPSVPLKAGQLARIRVLVKMPREVVDGAGGLIVRDSLGGETLQVKLTSSIRDWSEVVIFRRAPADCDLSVLLGLSGYGTAYFDALRIDVLSDTTPGAVPSSPSLPNPSPLTRQPLPRQAVTMPRTQPAIPRR